MNASTFVHPYYFALYPQGATVTPRAHGLDISKYDQFFKPETATGQLDFVVQRVSYGIKRDEAFDVLVPGVMRTPIRGGYHYLSSWYDWRTQADAYLDYVAGYNYDFHCCDFEGAFNTLSPAFAKQAWDWIDYVEQRTGKRTLLYTSLSLYNQYIAPSEKAYGIMWNTVPLWQAQWLLTPNPNGTPGTPTGRQVPWRLWQYTDKGDGTKYGVARATACDLDVYNGTVEDMRTWLEITAPTPPPSGGTMEKWKVLGSLKVRSGPSTAFAQVQSLNLDDVIEGVFDAVSSWINISKIIRVSGATFSPTPPVQWWCSGLAAYVEKIVAPPPAVKVTDTIIKLAPGSTVTTKYSDGSTKTETA